MKRLVHTVSALVSVAPSTCRSVGPGPVVVELEGKARAPVPVV